MHSSSQYIGQHLTKILIKIYYTHDSGPLENEDSHQTKRKKYTISTKTMVETELLPRLISVLI